MWRCRASPGAATVTHPAGAALLARLAANLIDNAIRYNNPGGQIGVQVTTSDGRSVPNPIGSYAASTPTPLKTCR